MHLLVGLGNPGSKYTATRHNIGFMFLDHLAGKHDLLYKSTKWQASMAKDRLWNTPVLVQKPETFMNLSGKAVAGVARFYQIPPEKIIVVHDDLDLPLGRIKIVVMRGAGGHNGIRSIIEALGSKKFIRIRVGIGRPQDDMDVSSYVLSRFEDSEKEQVQKVFLAIEESVQLVIEQGVDAAMNRINVHK